MTKPRAFLVLNDSKLEPKAKAGTVVFDSLKPDYGISAEDTRLFGYDSISVTLDSTGDYPFFTMPRHDLRLAEPTEIAGG